MHMGNLQAGEQSSLGHMSLLHRNYDKPIADNRYYIYLHIVVINIITCARPDIYTI